MSTCPKCGSVMKIADKPEGFLRLYGAWCPVCWPERKALQNRIVAVGVTAILAVCVYVAWVSFGPESKPDLSCTVIHEPKSGCPEGYVREATPRFTERNGTKQYACRSHDPSKEHCVDVLNPGESEDVQPFLEEAQ